MNRWILLFLGSIILWAGTSVALAQTPSPTPATSTQPAQEQSQSFYDQLRATEIAAIMEGKEPLTWDEIRKPEFWFYNFKDLIVTVIAFVPRFIGTMVFLFVFWLIYRGIRRMIVGNMKEHEVDSSIRDLLGALVKWTVMGFGIVIACNQLGIPIVAMLTGISIIGLAVGFAAQETLANFIAGIVIFIDQPFKAGDWVEMHDTFGQVKRVTFRSTRVLTLDGEIVVVPNTQVLANKLSNRSSHPFNRINVAVGIAYKASIDDARKALVDLTKDDSRLLKSPSPEVIVKDLGESSVNLVLRFWIEDESLAHRIVYEYTEKAKKALDAAGIEIPFPHMQLFIENTPAVAALAGNGRGMK
ncbi:MAG TPA: mechanosensitive ion channel family protein [Tepidisphaeraceae bacterium]|nr:mechanosensitive ion channel family protein [Tepidisphaeraceae bacterium]